MRHVLTCSSALVTCTWLPPRCPQNDANACYVDIQFHRNNRLDIALVRNHSLALIFLPAADIPRFVAEGNVHLGITGQDQVAEFSLSAEEGHGEIHEILELNFGKCSLQVQVPELGDIQDASQLIGKRVVTSFIGLTKKFFAKLEANGNHPYDTGHTHIKYVGGSVEAACALGVADGVVDLVGILRFCTWNDSRVR